MAHPATTALAPVSTEPAPIVRAVSSEQLEGALAEYRRVQTVLDVALPDCIMAIQGKSFRKKNYWRAVTTAFNLDVVLEHEERIEAGDDWGYVVTYRATAPNGRSATGDGASMISEKAGKMRTLHNVRSHAHTRAYNRAVSNLVGFGEVSAEEVERDEEPRREEPRQVRRPVDPPFVNELRTSIGDALKRDSARWTEDDVRMLLEHYGARRAADMEEPMAREAISYLAGPPPTPAPSAAK